MLKALLKKELLQLNSFYFFNRKTGKTRSRRGTVGFILLFSVLILYLCGALFVVCITLAPPLFAEGRGALYFALVAVLATLLGTFGSAFSTYSALYLAKDNETLLAMPIPPSLLLLVRMIGVYLMGLFYEAIFYLPALLAYYVCGAATTAGVICSLLLFPILGLFVLALSCLLGFLVALIATRLKGKSYLTVLISLAFFGIYYYFCATFMSTVNTMLSYTDTVDRSMRTYFYPFYLFGRGAAGEIPAFLLSVLILAALAVLTHFVLAKTYLRIALRGQTSSRRRGTAKAAARRSVTAALFRKEWKRFSSSATYMLNSAPGTALFPIVGVALLIFSPNIRAVFGEIGVPAPYYGVAVLAIAAFTAPMNDTTAPSISLEGKSLWLLQTMPVPPTRVFFAKQLLQWVLTMPVELFLVIAAGIAFGVDFLTVTALSLFVLAFVAFLAAMGLVVNLRHLNLEWSNETAVIKQSAGVAICLLGGWGIGIVSTAAAALAVSVLPLSLVALLFAVLFSLGAFLLNRSLATRGAARFATL